MGPPLTHVAAATFQVVQPVALVTAKLREAYLSDDGRARISHSEMVNEDATGRALETVFKLGWADFERNACDFSYTLVITDKGRTWLEQNDHEVIGKRRSKRVIDVG